MKFAVVILACVAAASAQFNAGAYSNGAYKKNAYNPFANQYKYKPTPAPYRTYTPLVYPSSTAAPLRVVPVVPVPVPRYAGDAHAAQILKYGNEVNPDGSYSYFYETDNGISAQAQGTPRDFGGNPPVVPVVSQGSFGWTSPEGQPIAITYVADENGYQPSGSAIPTPHPIPEAILRSIAYNARNAAAKK